MILKQEPLEHDVWLISVGGRLDQESTTEFENEVINILAEGRTRLLVDLSQVTYVNSGGLRCLVTIWRQAREKSGDVCLVNINENIDQVFSMVGFDKVFNIFDDLDSALDHFAHDVGLE